MQIQLNEKYTIRLSDLIQYYTYGGLIMGSATEKDNNEQIEQSCEYAKKKLNTESVYLIEPVRTWTTREFFGNIALVEDPYQRAMECRSDKPLKWRNSTLERLPLITCCATFLSAPVVDEREMDISQLSVVWFQDQFAMPIDADIIKHLQGLDWEAVAQPYWF
ncbi:hypothetical protein [Thiothrix sp.]|jgi:hypothetical protein|uniref:hypothetical protein n=1 Tax=Thiothrix sp. TaxID=1032 RepID=UPI00257D5F59|nr:hypothetical protein [Thiothrix sp.]